jgi:integrase/recombinase XerD
MKKEPTKELTVINQNNALQIKDAAWKSLSQESQKSYGYDYKLFYEVIKKDPKDITATDIQQYIKYLEDNNYKNNSISRKIASLSKMFRVMVMAGEIRINPIEVLKQFQRISFKTSKSVQIALTMRDIKTVTKTDKETPAKDRKTIIIIRVLASTGMRISECINIKNEDIREFDADTYIVKILGKGKKERKIYLSSNLLQDIKKVFPDGNSIYLFYTGVMTRCNRRNLWKAVNEIFGRKIGKSVHPHSLRHWFATYKISIEKKDITAVSKFLGHSSPSITMDFYIDTELNAEDAKLKI